MFASFPIVAYLLFCLIAYRDGGGGVRRAMIAGAVWWGVATVALTEGLSLFGGLSFGAVLAGWGVVCMGAGYALLSSMRRRAWPALDTSAEWPGILVVPVLFLGGLAVALLVVALVAPPNNYDSMTYHMARVAHWVQNGSVRFYPTHNPRQLHLAPFAEYAVLQFQLLAGSDRFANGVQWFAYAVGLVAVSRMAKQLGAGVMGQAAAAVVAGTIPMAVLQATSTQNDLVLGLWLVALTSFGLELREAPDKVAALLAGGALGLAVLTKGSAYPLAFPLVVWIGVSVGRRYRGRAVAPLALAAGLALAVNVGHYARNHSLYGSPLGPGTELDATRFKYTNDVHTPGAIVSNLLRNVAIHVAAPSGAPRGPQDRAAGAFNGAVANAVVTVHRWLGIDVDDPRTTWTSNTFSVWGEGWSNENFAPAPLHVLLLAGCLVTLAFVRMAHRRALLGLGGCIVLGFVLFCVVLKWQQWHVRLHLPLLMLGAVLAGVVLERAWNRYVGAGVLAGLMVLSVFPMVYNASHPWGGPNSVFELKREDQYFMWAPGYRDFYRVVAQNARQRRCENVGVVCGSNDPVYPLWVLLRRQNPRARLESWEVKNATAVYAGRPPYAGFKPDMTFVVDSETGKVELKFGE